MRLRGYQPVNNKHQSRNTPDRSKKNTDQIWKPHATVAAVIERDNKYLMVEEPIGGHIMLNQPAGHLEDNETLINAIIREVREETAWQFTPEYILGIYLWRNPEQGNTYLRTTFVGSVSDHNPNQPLYDGIIKASWKTLDELQSESSKLRSPLILSCINDYLAGNSYPLNLIRDNTTLN